MIIWARHRTAASRFCAIGSVDDCNTTTACSGSWDSIDSDEFELSTNPNQEQRCAACVRELQRGRIETGLRELERVTR